MHAAIVLVVSTSNPEHAALEPGPVECVRLFTCSRFTFKDNDGSLANYKSTVKEMTLLM
jgi:hypothetical protein